jgi:uncharacterized membrane protein
MLYIKILLLLLILDFIWIGLIFKNYFSPMINEIQNSPMKVRILPAIISYIFLFLLAIIFLPKCKNVYESFLLGFCVYGVYDATNLATIKKWNYSVAIVDMLWGGILFSVIYSLLINSTNSE